jgi:hypothetical protein
MPEVKDEYAGQGGSYILDPETGVRTLVDRTDMPAPAVAPAQDPAPAETAPATETSAQG